MKTTGSKDIEDYINFILTEPDKFCRIIHKSRAETFKTAV